MGNLISRIWPSFTVLITALYPSTLHSHTSTISEINDTIDYIHPLDSVVPKMESAYLNGFEAYSMGDFVKADSFWTLSLKFNKNLYSETDFRVAENLINLGAANLKLWNYEYALTLFSEAEKIYTKIDNNHLNLGAIYVNIAIIYSALRDYEKALMYYGHAIFIYKNQKVINYESLFYAYRNLSNLYRITEDYSKAIESITTGIYYDKTKSISRLIDYNNLIAVYYSQTGDYPLAEKHYKEAIRLAKRNPELASEYTDVPSITMNYAVFQMDHLNNNEEAKSLLFQSLKSFENNKRLLDDNKTICLHNIGEAYFRCGQLDSSLIYFQRSLISAIPDFTDMDIYSNPTISVENQKARILNTLKWKANLFYIRFNETKNIRDIEFSLQTYLLIYDFIDQMRLKYDSETSNFLVSKQEDNTFLRGIEVAEKLYSLTNNNKYLELDFKINEKRKSFTLLTSIRKTEAKEFGGIPIPLLKKEKNLFNFLAAYEENIFEERRKLHPDADKINMWEETKFELLMEYNSLVKTFEDDYPEYYRLKYDASTISIAEIQEKMQIEESVIEYALMDNQLYTFLINKNKAKIFKQSIDSTLYQSIDNLRKTIAEPNFSERVQESYANYCEDAYQLYKILLDTVSADLHNKSLLIIPGGSLWYIPFEVLLTSPINDSSVNYRHLPYLIRDYPVSYAYSATLHFEANQRPARPKKELLAFAPNYSALLAQNVPPRDLDFLEQYREQLVPIPGVKDEVRLINRLVEGDIYMDEEATETRFKQDAENYDILHLAMHTIVNNEDPMYSKLAFVQNVDSLNDGFLNTYEIYNMRFNARMAVLSSCKTGFGKLMKGEGVMSLARGFMYAGCPSIIMTLWEVSDKSGAKLMQDFYQSLIKGKSKAEALQIAKLNFLKKADNLKANPYFWSTYVIIGDASPLFEKNRSYLYWIGGFLLISVGFLGFFLWNQRKKRKSDKRYQPDTMYS